LKGELARTLAAQDKGRLQQETSLCSHDSLCSLHHMEASEAFCVMGTAPLRICWADSQRREMREKRGQPYSASSIQ